MNTETTRNSKNNESGERIAVVIPALNAADTIRMQIAAVLADRDERVELVLVNNCDGCIFSCLMPKRCR